MRLLFSLAAVVLPTEVIEVGKRYIRHQVVRFIIDADYPLPSRVGVSVGNVAIDKRFPCRHDRIMPRRVRVRQFNFGRALLDVSGKLKTKDWQGDTFFLGLSRDRCWDGCPSIGSSQAAFAF